MIDEIEVEDLALIRHATLEPAAGLTVLTGETGAGKTALVSALKLLMGARADKEAVRDGSEALLVSGRFLGLARPEGDAADGVDAADADELVATRRVGADGRSRVSIDGRMASVHELAGIVAPSVDLCGQHEHQQLMRTSSHLHLLDAWAGEEVAGAREAYEQAFAAAEAAAAELARVQEAARSSQARVDEARFTLRRIDEVDPREGEDEELSEELSRSEHAEALAVSANVAHEFLTGDQGAIDSLDAAAQALEEGGRYDKRLAELGSSLREAGYVLEDVAREARDYRDEVEYDPEQLARQQERMASIQGLMRSYGPRLEDVLARRQEAAELLALVDDSEAAERAAQKALDAAEAELAEAAERLDAARKKAAPRFAAAVTEQMQRLEMGGAQLVCAVEPLPRESWTKSGPHSVEFLFSPGVGTHPRPLSRIASGGELSRVMLALKVALGQADEVDTLVFDEVDAGVGGTTAVALAEVIADLAKSHQVIVVTHLAQVAVRADAHYAVRKQEGEDARPETVLVKLSEEERPAEIARMLSGDETEASLAHAREMLAAAR